MRKKIAFTYRKILLMALAALMICAPALAIDKIDEGAATSLTVAFAPEGTPAEGAEFALYRVKDGEMQSRSVLEFTMTGESYRNAMALPVGTYTLVMTRAQ